MRVLPVVATLATMSLSLNRSIKFSPHHIPHMAISRTKKIIGGVVIILAAGAVFCYHKPETTQRYFPADLCNILRIPRTMPGSYIQSILTAEDWTNPEQATAKLTKLIDERLQSTDPEAVAQFISEPQNRLLLADANMLTTEKRGEQALAKIDEQRRADLDQLKKEHDELMQNVPAGTQPPAKFAHLDSMRMQRIKTIEDELAANHSIPQSTNIAELVGSNLDWAAQLSSSGEDSHTGETLSILQKIADKDPDMPYDTMKRNIATATALEFARQGLSQDDAVNRVELLTRAWEKGDLNKSFNKLPMWQMRVVCGLKGRGVLNGAFSGNDQSGSVNSMKFSQQNVHLPAYRYTGSCWQAPYRTYNIYGDSVQGPFYHAPFNEFYDGKFNQLTREVGGVCGGLSHYGATTATANGIPALTAGEPAHCSYVVLVDGKWTPAYSLSWQRGLHWQVFSGVHVFSSLRMADKLFSPEQEKQTNLSSAQLSLANLYATSDTEKARGLYLDAIKSQPLNYYAWRDYTNFLTTTAADNPTPWLELCDNLNANLAQAFPEMTATMLRQLVYPNLKKMQGANKEELRRVAVDFWKNVQEMGPDPEWDKSFKGRWDVENMLNSQLDMLGFDPKKDGAALDFLRDALREVAKKTDYATVMLSWSAELSKALPDDKKAEVLKAMTSALGSGTGSSDDDREKLLNPVILAAEAAGDLNSFNALSSSLPPQYKNPPDKLPDTPVFPGQLVSRGGMIRASSTSSWDKPCSHWGLLEPGIGGVFHTGKDENAWVVVTLPKQANLTGITLVTTDRNLNRLDNMKVQVSETGRDDDWHDVAQLGACKQKVLQVDLSAAQPLAKFVRILRPGGPDFFHLRGIFVYGKPAA